MTAFDVIVIGTGAMGSATCYALAKRGINVLGIEQFSIAHKRGSSHGHSRLIRKAYFEHPDYVPLCERSYTLWDELSSESGRELFHRTGLVLFGPAFDTGVLKGVLESARLYDIPVQAFDADAAPVRFPQFILPEGYCAVLEPDAGYLEVEACVRTFCELATHRGATIHVDERVIEWRAHESGVEVMTDRNTYTAGQLIITAGAWSSQLLESLQLPLVVHRVPQFWFDAPAALHVQQAMPCFAFDLPGGFIYGMPASQDVGLKIGLHAPGEVVSNPSQLRRELLPEDVSAVERVRGGCFAGLSARPIDYSVCMYTMTPDEHFIVDVHPHHSHVAFAAGFSGHGFKFAPVIGEVLADLALDGITREPVGFLRMR